MRAGLRALARQVLAFSRANGDPTQGMGAIDPYDERLLRELARDGRVSNVELARRVGLSASATLRRVQALERDGVIAGYRATLARDRVGRGFLAYVAVGLADHSKAAQEAFERSIKRAREVSECHNVTGTVEYLLRVECANLDAYKVFHTDVLGALPGVATITSYIVMASPKDERG